MMPHESNYLEVFRHLLDYEREMMLDLAHVTESLPHLIEQLLPGTARLVLSGAAPASVRQIPSSWHPFPVSSRTSTFGTLFIAPDPIRPKVPLLPNAIISLLVLLCGTLLTLFEQQILLQGTTSSPVLDVRLSEPLTQRQREILTLMSQGYEEREIARRLHITKNTVKSHLHTIYARLGVHAKHDAIRVAYLAHLFSPLDFVGEENVRPL